MDSLLTIKVENSKTIRIKCLCSSADRSKKRVITLVYDTGADKTSITRRTLEELHYNDFKQSAQLKRSAQGVFAPEVCFVSELVIGNQFRLSNFNVDVLEVENSPTFDGMIGMDFITQVENNLSGKNGTLTIRA